ncbi:MAG: methyltransferase domain-containing protein, partial [Candidatus Aenigmatarchaeota archaeon]
LRRKIRGKRIKNKKMINSDYCEIKFPDEYADVIFFSLSFPAHSKNRNADLRKFRKILKPGGVMIIVDTVAGGEWWNTRKLLGLGKSMIPRNTKWVLGKGFKRAKIMDSLLEYKNRENILKSVKPFFGGEMAGYLIGKGRTSFKIRIGVFCWKKK